MLQDQFISATAQLILFSILGYIFIHTLTVITWTGIRTRSLVIETIVVATAAGVVERYAAILRSAKRPGRVFLCAVAWLLW